MKIAIGSDHGGFKLKKSLIDYLRKNGHNIIDVGCFSDERCDYPQYSYEAAVLVSKKRADRAVTNKSVAAFPNCPLVTTFGSRHPKSAQKQFSHIFQKDTTPFSKHIKLCSLVLCFSSVTKLTLA